jgi:hypothetical protein
MVAIFAIALIFSGCAGLEVRDKQLEQKEYKLDLKVSVNNIESKGVLVVNKSDNYQIEVEAPDDSDYVTINTCHREIVLRDQKERFKTKIYPTEIEKDGYCPMIINAFSPKYKFAGAFIDFIDTDLDAGLICNGTDLMSHGSGVCQSKAGLLQRIKFENETIAANPSIGCERLIKNGNSFDIKTSKGKCVYTFKSGDKIYRLTMIGYEEYQMRK